MTETTDRLPWHVVLAEDQPFDRAEAKAALLRGSTRRYAFAECETAAEAEAAVAAAVGDAVGDAEGAAETAPEAGAEGTASEAGSVTVLLLDYRLPDADAPDVIARLPRVPGTDLPAVPVVVVTGADRGPDGGARNRAVLRAGAQDFIGKDWLTPASLTRAVEAAVERHRMARELQENRRALQESEATLSAVLDALPVGVVIADADGRITRDNAANRELWGTPPETTRWEQYGAWVGYWPDSGRRIRAEEWGLARALRSGEVVRNELVENERFGTGERRLFLNNAAPIRNGAGEVVAGVVAELDVTDRLAAEAALRESEARFRTLADASPSIVFTYGADGQRDYVNRRWHEYTGRPGAGEPDRQLRDALHPDDRDRVARVRAEAVAAGETFEVEYRLRRHDGAYRWFLARVVPDRDGSGAVARWFGTATDIHEQKAAEAELVRRVAARTVELERSNRELDQFAYVASHDLKAPLRAIDSLATWIEEDAGPLLPAESLRHLALLRARVGRMEGLLESLLAYSRVGRKESAPEPVDTGAVVADVLALVSPPEGFDVRVEGDFPTVVTARTPFELVVRNLVSNAIKHHDRPEHGHVTISAEVAPAEVAPTDRPAPGGWVTFTVADDGPGIPPEYQDRVFGLFQTLRPRDEVEGSGMGLAIVRKTVESRGGAISLASSGRGATFRFTWPLHPPAA